MSETNEQLTQNDATEETIIGQKIIAALREFTNTLEMGRKFQVTILQKRGDLITKVKYKEDR